MSMSRTDALKNSKYFSYLISKEIKKALKYFETTNSRHYLKTYIALNSQIWLDTIDR